MDIKYLNLIDYSTAHRLQLELVSQRIDDEIDDTLLLLEHPPVIVKGKSAKDENILAAPELLRQKNVKVVESSRGGDVTVHSAGQVVGYPIFKLKNNDLNSYLRNLEKIIIYTLKDYGILGYRIDGYTGVWVGEEKICSIGIAVSKWVAYHGFALNVNNDLGYFLLLHPCGIKGLKITSLSEILGRKMDIIEVQSVIIKHFKNIFSGAPIKS